MKIIHLPYTYFPDPSGGTEVYVHTLAKALQQCGVESLVVAPGSEAGAYEYEGVRIRRLAVSDAHTDLRVIYGAGDTEVAQQFEALLDEVMPDVVHLHAFTGAISLQLVNAARQRGRAVVYTYHTPTGSCARGTLLHWGRAICDGRLQVRRCSACTLHGLGLNRPSSWALGILPSLVRQWAANNGRQGRVWTALRMSELIALQHTVVRGLWASVDRIIVLCDWAQALLQNNGVAPGKITLCRHGLTLPESDHFAPRPDPASHRPLRLVFLGRLDRAKGIDLVVRALSALPEAPLTLDIYGILPGGAKTAWHTLLLEWARSDQRLHVHDPLPPTEVVPRLRDYDALVVPSRGLETGPRVVLEAFAAGLPVLGSDLGGIAEQVQHNVTGWLVPVDSVGGWVNVLQLIAAHPELLSQWRTAIQLPRTMADVADEMIRVYQETLDR